MIPQIGSHFFFVIKTHIFYLLLVYEIYKETNIFANFCPMLCFKNSLVHGIQHKCPGSYPQSALLTSERKGEKERKRKDNSPLRATVKNRKC